MKRNLVALAVAGAALAPAAALADGSGVVLTGVIHGSVDFFQAKDENGGKPYKRQASIGNNATRWQIDGTEDLGWSKAIFSLAFDQPFAGCGRISDQCGGRNLGAFNGNGNNTNELSNRNSYLGLTGGWGTLKIGQNENQYEIQPILQDPDPASEAPFNALTMLTRYGVGNTGNTTTPTGQTAAVNLNGGTNGLTRRSAGSIWYTSPDFGGVTIDVAYITPNGRKSGDNTDPSLSPFGVEFAAQWKAPFGLSIYGSVAQYNDDGGTDNKNRALGIGVGYGMELFQVDARFEQLKFDANQANGIVTNIVGFNNSPLGQVDEVKRRHFYLAGSLNFGQNHIRLAYTQAFKAKTNAGDIEDSEARNIFLAYAYTLSKRTELQAVIGKTDNKRNASYNTGVAGRDLDGLSLGVRHSF